MLLQRRFKKIWFWKRSKCRLSHVTEIRALYTIRLTRNYYYVYYAIWQQHHTAIDNIHIQRKRKAVEHFDTKQISYPNAEFYLLKLKQNGSFSITCISIALAQLSLTNENITDQMKKNSYRSQWNTTPISSSRDQSPVLFPDVVVRWSASSPSENVIDHWVTDLSDAWMSFTAWTTTAWISSGVGRTAISGMLSDALQRNNALTPAPPSAATATMRRVSHI